MILIKNANVMMTTEPLWQEGYVLVEADRIIKTGMGQPSEDLLAKPDMEVIEAGGDFVLPGMIDAHCHVGLFNDGLSDEGSDGNEMTDPITPHMQACDGVYQADRAFAEALEHGITSVMTGPGSANVIAGTFAFMRTNGRTVDDMARVSQAAMKAAFGENPKRVYGGQSKTPATRMATAALLRDSLYKATAYKRHLEKLENEEQAINDKYDVRWAALQPVLRGDMILKIHAHRSDDILTAVRIANEYGLRYTLDHCTEGYLIADILAREYENGQHDDCGKGLPGKGQLLGIITGPLLSDRSKPELSKASIKNPSLLAAAGIPVAIMTDHPVIPIQYLPVSAAVAMREGMTEAHALQAITLTAARLCGLDDQLGSIEAGKLADLVIMSGHPLDIRSKVKTVLIDGVRQQAINQR